MCFQFSVLSQASSIVEKDSTKVFSVQHRGQVLYIRPGEFFVLMLPNPGSGGYVIQDPEFNPQILTLQEMKKKPPSDAGREGDFGGFEWRFRARQEGISSLIVRAIRPWEKDRAPVVIFEAAVQVSQRSP